MSEITDERPQIPAPQIDYKKEILEFGQKLGADYIYPGIEFGQNYALDEAIATERAQSLRQKLLGVNVTKIEN